MIPTSTLRGTFSACIAALCAALPSTASAATTITVDSVVQRWPWNNKVDITYTVADGQDVAQDVYRRIVFTAVIDGETYAIDGTTEVGASATTGTHDLAGTGAREFPLRKSGDWSVEHEGEDDATLRPSPGNPRKRALVEGFRRP